MQLSRIIVCSLIMIIWVDPIRPVLAIGCEAFCDKIRDLIGDNHVDFFTAKCEKPTFSYRASPSCQCRFTFPRKYFSSDLPPNTDVCTQTGSQTDPNSRCDTICKKVAGLAKMQTDLPSFMDGNFIQANQFDDSCKTGFSCYCGLYSNTSKQTTFISLP